MIDGLFSTFGNYDFFGKSFPGMVLVTALLPLLPSHSISSLQLGENPFSLAILLVIVALLGMLIGEFVHGLANLLERTVAWGGRRIRETVHIAAGAIHCDFRIPSQPVKIQRMIDGSFSSDKLNEKSDGDVSPLEMPWFRRQVYKVRQWVLRRYRNILYAFLPHRKIFTAKLTSGVEEPYGSAEYSPSEVSFTDEYLFQKATDEFNIRYPVDAAQVYSVIVSTLGEARFERSFRFQSRQAFCRSMWMVLTAISITYPLLLFGPLPGGIGTGFRNTSYLSGLSVSEVGFLSTTALLVAMVFAAASGAYKRYYVEYLISELYVLDNGTDTMELDSTKNSQIAS